MKYEKTGDKVNKDTAKNARDYALTHVSTSTMLWHLVKRHKFGLVSTYAVALTAVWLFPPLPDIIRTLI